uniref:Uncharacterized protein n=1 Tax=Meloidogyne enterolobii TaxID=390850 RepID=A0A6V7U8T6_MELEN|nr:unnamed protein product [Meloidogyne enterolobii]
MIKEEENNITTKQITEEENNNLLIKEDESKEFLEMKLIKKEELNLAILKLDKQIHENGDLNNINFEELQKYKENLKRIITTIDTALNTMENNENNLVEEKEGENSLNKNKLIKQLIKDNFKIKSAISSSLPNWRSKYLLNRINSFNKNVEENIRKSPLQLTNKTTTTTLIPQTNNSEENITTKTTSTINTTTIIPLLNQTFNENIGENISTTTEKEKEENTDILNDSLNDSLTTSTSSTSNSKPNILLQSNKLFIPKIIIQNSIKNLTSNILDQCKHLSQPELVDELKRKGTYNPELMAWDVSGVFRFLDRSIVDQYEKQIKTQKSGEQAIKRNIEALEKLLGELKLHCNIRTPEALSRFGNITLANPKHSIISPSMRGGYWEEGEENIMMTRQKRNTLFAQNLFNSSSERRKRSDFKNKKQLKSQIGDVHIVPFGCDKRGYSEDGYLRLCSACQAIRKLPGDFFPPFINEVVCNEDKACLYFYEYPHGKCKQKYMNFVVLRNVGTPLCQVWEKFNLNVRVSCECFVDEMSFFAKYV